MSKKEKIEAVIAEMKTLEKIRDGVIDIVNVMITALAKAYSDKGLGKKFNTVFNEIMQQRTPEFMEVVVKIFNETFNEDEVDQLLTFFKSSAGAKYSSDAMTKAMAKSGEAWMENVVGEVREKMIALSGL